MNTKRQTKKSNKNHGEETRGKERVAKTVDTRIGAKKKTKEYGRKKALGGTGSGKKKRCIKKKPRRICVGTTITRKYGLMSHIKTICLTDISLCSGKWLENILAPPASQAYSNEKEHGKRRRMRSRDLKLVILPGGGDKGWASSGGGGGGGGGARSAGKGGGVEQLVNRRSSIFCK